MGIIAWLVLGLIAGFVASKIYTGHGQGVVMDIVLGVVGAFVGGIIMTAITGRGFEGFDIWSIITAIIGAIVVLAIYHAVIGKRSTTSTRV